MDKCIFNKIMLCGEVRQEMENKKKERNIRMKK